MSKNKAQVAKERLMELKTNHRALQHSTEASMVRVLEILQHYQANFLNNSEELEKLKQENFRLKSEVQRLEFSLNDVRLTASAEAEMRLKFERELDDYRRLIALLKDLVNSGGREGTHLSRLGDKDRELLDLATNKHTMQREARTKPRVSDKFNRTPDFKLNHRSWCSDGESSSQPDLNSSGEGEDENKLMKEIKRKSKRRSSVHVPEETPKQKVVRYETSKWPLSAHVGSAPALPSTGSSSTSSLDSASQPKHCFTKKTILRSEDCTHCSRKLKFGTEAQKCKNCKFVCHTACRNEALLRACAKTVSSNGVRSIGSLSQFTPSQPPYVPKVLATIVKEIEARGRTESGIYRIPGTHRLVADIMDQISRNKTPYLSGHDIHTVCSVMKDFIRRLDEPVVTYRLHDQFMQLADLSESDASAAIMSLVSELPAVNRDTLAFLMLHLKRVASWKHCSMGTENLSKILGPSLIRHSASSNSAAGGEIRATVLEETRRHPIIMQRLFQVPEHFWSQFLTPPQSGGAQHDTDATSSESDAPQTPGNMFTTPGMLRTINEERQLDSGGTGTDSDTPVLYGPSSAVAHRTRYRNVGIKGSRYFTSPLR